MSSVLTPYFSWELLAQNFLKRLTPSLKRLSTIIFWGAMGEYDKSLMVTRPCFPVKVATLACQNKRPVSLELALMERQTYSFTPSWHLLLSLGEIATKSRLQFLSHCKLPSPTPVKEMHSLEVEKLQVGQIWCRNCSNRKRPRRPQESGARITAARRVSRSGIWSVLSCDKIGHLGKQMPFFFNVYPYMNFQNKPQLKLLCIFKASEILYLNFFLKWRKVFWVMQILKNNELHKLCTFSDIETLKSYLTSSLRVSIFFLKMF